MLPPIPQTRSEKVFPIKGNRGKNQQSHDEETFRGQGKSSKLKLMHSPMDTDSGIDDDYFRYLKHQQRMLVQPNV
jgi:hypothetical protein